MKAIITLTTLMTLNILLFSQINLEHTYTPTDGVQLQYVYLANSGFKFQLYDLTTNTLRLYNLNYSIFKSINMPVNPNYTFNGDVHYISETLFDNDSTNVEFIRTGYNPTTYTYTTEIINESGNIIFTRDSCTCNIIQTGINSAKMELTYYTSLGDVHYNEIYSLPGFIPSLCCNNGIPTTNNNLNPNSIHGELLCYPNPSKDYTQIEFELPKNSNNGTLNLFNLSGILIKSYKIDNTFKNIRLSTNDIQSGSYMYSIQTSNGIIGTKKLIIIK